MKIQLIRNAIMKITYGGPTFLTDPMLSPKGGVRSFCRNCQKSIICYWMLWLAP